MIYGLTFETMSKNLKPSYLIFLLVIQDIESCPPSPRLDCSIAKSCVDRLGWFGKIFCSAPDEICDMLFLDNGKYRYLTITCLPLSKS